MHLKLGIAGISGSGKTFSALRLARGLVGKNGRIAFLDTENRSASLYADIVTSFDVINVIPPYRYIDFYNGIKDAVSEGYDVVIIDSATHFWDAIKDYVSEIKQGNRSKNEFAAWNEGTAAYKKVLYEILQSPIHVISCCRSKMEYAMEKDSGTGKNKVDKIGLAPEVRDGFEYEATVFFDLDMTILHQGTAEESIKRTARTSKDRTQIFEPRGGFLITEETGELLAEWIADMPAENINLKIAKVVEIMEITGKPEEEVKELLFTHFNVESLYRITLRQLENMVSGTRKKYQAQKEEVTA